MFNKPTFRNAEEIIESGVNPNTETFAAFVSLRVVLNIFILIHDRHRFHIASFDAFKQIANLIFS